MIRKKDQWDAIAYPELSKKDNQLIRRARRKGFAAFWPCYPDSKAQADNTLIGAKEYLKSI